VTSLVLMDPTPEIPSAILTIINDALLQSIVDLTRAAITLFGLIRLGCVRRKCRVRRGVNRMFMTLGFGGEDPYLQSDNNDISEATTKHKVVQ
jgi:hypothetical protein